MGHVQEMENANTILMWEPGRKRTLGIPRRIWQDNIKMNITGTGGRNFE